MISIIMPVYNAEKYLSEAIESVLNQTYTDYELLLVDDGSTDMSGKLCDQYAEYNEKIKVIHKENGGVSSARRVGYETAIGEWIAFMDNDDIISPYFLSHLYEYSDKADIISGSGINIDDKDIAMALIKNHDVGDDSIDCLTGYEAAEIMNYSNNKYGMVALLWGKIILREVMEKAVTLADEYKDEIPLNYFEDMFLAPRLFISADKVVIKNEVMYYHRVCSDSPSHTLTMKTYNYEQIEVCNINLEYYKRHNLLELYKGQLFHYYLIVLKIWYGCNKNEKDETKKKWCNDKVDYYYNKYYSDLSNNEYIGIVYKAIIKLFGLNKKFWSLLIGDLYFNRLYKYRRKLIR